jgi:hypothetical protein
MDRGTKMDVAWANQIQIQSNLFRMDNRSVLNHSVERNNFWSVISKVIKLKMWYLQNSSHFKLYLFWNYISKATKTKYEFSRVHLNLFYHLFGPHKWIGKLERGFVMNNLKTMFHNQERSKQSQIYHRL